MRPFGSSWFDAKMRRLPSGCQDGAKLAPPSVVTCRRFDAVAVHHEELERRRTPERLLQQRADSRRAPCPAASGRPRNTICVPSGEKNGPPSGPGRFVSRFTSRPVGVHRVDLHVAVAHAGEHDEAVGRDRRLGVVAGRPRQRRRCRCRRGWRDRCRSSRRSARRSRARSRASAGTRRRRVRRRVEDRACRPGRRTQHVVRPVPVLTRRQVGAVDLHREDLVAAVRRRAWTGRSAGRRRTRNTPRRSRRREVSCRMFARCALRARAGRAPARLPDGRRARSGAATRRAAG